MKKINIWWLLMVAGIMYIAIGAFSLVSPLKAYIVLVRYSGFFLLLNGILLIIISYTSTGSLKEKEWMLSESVLDLLFAVALLFNPFLSFIAFPFLIGPWMIGKGILKIASGLSLSKLIYGTFLIFIAGALSIVFGLLILFYKMERPDGITIFIGAFALVIGALYVFDSLRFRKTADSINMML